MSEERCANCAHLSVCAICKPWPFDCGCDEYMAEVVRCHKCALRGSFGCPMYHYVGQNRDGDDMYIDDTRHDGYCDRGERKDSD